MGAFSGQLNRNRIQNALFNMIISIKTFADNIKGTNSELVDMARVDGSLFGDQKLYLATQNLKSYEWGADSEATNLLALDRPPAPQTQAIVLDKFRQIRCTVDDYLSKQSFLDMYSFSEYTSVMIGWISETKRIYESTLYNSFLGSAETSIGKQMVSLPVAAARANASTEEEANRLEVECIAQGIADLLVEMRDVSRDFNDYGFLRSHSDEEIKVIWNSKYVNKIRKVDTPSLFHRDGLVDKFSEHVLPSRYFGTVITSSNISDFSASTPAAGKPIDSDDHTYVPGSNHANGCIRSLVEKDVEVSATEYHVFPGDEIPAGATIVASTGDFLPGEVYIEKADVICKVVTELPPFMSAFEVGTSWFNPRSLTTTHFSTFGYNSLEFLKGKPFITVKAA